MSGKCFHSTNSDVFGTVSKKDIGTVEVPKMKTYAHDLNVEIISLFTYFSHFNRVDTVVAGCRYLIFVVGELSAILDLQTAA